MSTKVYQASKKIIDALKAISGVTVLSGWMQIYEKDLLQGKDGKGFPCLCVYYDKDQNNRVKGTEDNNITRSLVVAGAVLIVDGQDINETLDDLLFAVKKALVGVPKLTLPEVSFMLPEASNEYAMFVAKLSFTEAEKWQ